MKTKRVMVRLDKENLQWMDQYRESLGLEVSNTVLANMAIKKGKMAPLVSGRNTNKKRK
jgi:hypothetical protein